jgi:hypothetical protein
LSRSPAVICIHCGRADAIAPPPDEQEREREKLCDECANLPTPPEE